MRRVLVAAVLGLALAAPAIPAYAQGYPPPVVVDFGSVAVGGTLTGNLCGLPAFTSVTITVDGTGGLVKPADSTGCVHFTIQVTSQTSGIRASRRS